MLTFDSLHFTFIPKLLLFSRTTRPRRPFVAASATPVAGHWSRVANADLSVCVGIVKAVLETLDSVFAGWTLRPLHHHHKCAPHCNAQPEWSATHRSLAATGRGPPTPDHPLPPDGARRQVSSGSRDYHHHPPHRTHPLHAQPYDPKKPRAADEKTAAATDADASTTLAISI